MKLSNFINLDPNVLLEYIYNDQNLQTRGSATLRAPLGRWDSADRRSAARESADLEGRAGSPGSLPPSCSASGCSSGL